jgi:uncharacterized membrane protein (DUF2068 family)
MTEATQTTSPPRMRGAGLLRLIADVFVEWSRRLHIAPGNRIIEHLLEKILTVTHRQLIVFGIVLLIYAAMFAVEGIGLLLLKHWAEWMTVITTSGLIPFEVYEMVHRPSALKAAGMIVNIAVAIYLFEHVRREAAEKSKNSAQPHVNDTGI